MIEIGLQNLTWKGNDSVHMLFPGNPDSAGSSKRNSETSGIPGTGEKNGGRNGLKLAVGLFIM